MPVHKPRSGVWTPPPYTVPAGPDSPDYEFARRRSVEDALADDALISEFRAGGSLPERYGTGLDERIVEYPWLLAHQRGGPTLDAGSVLNHDFVLQRVLPHLAPLFTVTLRPEAHVFTDRGVSYIYADLRDLPLRDERFQTVICASTLEHVRGSITPRTATLCRLRMTPSGRSRAQLASSFVLPRAVGQSWSRSRMGAARITAGSANSTEPA